MRLFVVYASRYGQTEKIARRVAECARSEGASAICSPIGSLPGHVDLGAFDAVVVATPVFFGKPLRAARRFITRHLPALSAARNALVSVSMTAAFDPAAAEEHVHELVRRTGWIPETFTCVGGAEVFSRYGFFTRMIMKKIAREHGRNPSCDAEYTDWAALDRFTREFVAKVTGVTSSVGAARL